MREETNSAALPGNEAHSHPESQTLDSAHRGGEEPPAPRSYEHPPISASYKAARLPSFQMCSPDSQGPNVMGESHLGVGHQRPSRFRRDSLALPSKQEASSAADKSASILLDLMAYQRTFDGAYKRTSLAQLSFALMVLRLFQQSFYWIGVVSVILAVLLALAAWSRSDLGRENVYRMARSDVPAPWWEPMAENVHVMLDRDQLPSQFGQHGSPDQRCPSQHQPQPGCETNVPESSSRDNSDRDFRKQSSTSPSLTNANPRGRSATVSVPPHDTSHEQETTEEGDYVGALGLPRSRTTVPAPKQRLSLQGVLHMPSQFVQSTLALRTSDELRPFAEYGSASAFSYFPPAWNEMRLSARDDLGEADDGNVRPPTEQAGDRQVREAREATEESKQNTLDNTPDKTRRRSRWERVRIHARAVAWDAVQPSLHGVSHFKTAGNVVACVAFCTLTSQIAILVLILRM